MNRIKTLITTAVIFLFTAIPSESSSLDSLIQKSDINKTSPIAVSVKAVKSGKIIYQYNEHKLMNPASAQKVFTMRSAYNQLGKDYTFKTTAYIDKNSNLYIKLGADPSLTTSSLKNLLNTVAEKYNKPIKDIVLDGTIIDNKQWGTGWMWDDDANPYLPKYSPFSVNENKIDIVIQPGKNERTPEIKNKSPYSLMFVNMLKNGASKLKFTGNIKYAPVQSGAQKIAEINSVRLSELIATTLKNSNNFYSEMIFKTAAAEYSKKQGTTENAIEMFNKYYSDIKSEKPVIADACGISRNDLISADWMTEALNKLYKDKDFNDFVTLLPKPIEGTLTDRLLDISLKLRAKTGTASGISSITGYVDSKSGKKYSFAILIQNFSQPVINIKKFEDLIIREIYKM